MNSIPKEKATLNGICPYFTMFPLSFPYSVLKSNARKGAIVVDPFCGRGTTNFAARLLGFSSIGIDSSPVATAISKAKLVEITPKEITSEAVKILESEKEPKFVPSGEFWEYAFHPEVLFDLCKLRESLLDDCGSNSRIALRGIILGALHGPKPKTKVSYFSNQAQRTYAPKPNYALNYWKKHNLLPENINVISLIREKANRYFTEIIPSPEGIIINGDSRNPEIFSSFDKKIDWIITSPPYYGMKTYLPDQWLRLWFLGNAPKVNYSMEGQLIHASPQDFANDLKKVWNNLTINSNSDAKLVIRFGGINDRKANSLEILKLSIDQSNWRIIKINSAGSASKGKRQAIQIKTGISKPQEEFDIWAVKR